MDLGHNREEQPSHGQATDQIYSSKQGVGKGKGLSLNWCRFSVQACCPSPVFMPDSCVLQVDALVFVIVALVYAVTGGDLGCLFCDQESISC